MPCCLDIGFRHTGTCSLPSSVNALFVLYFLLRILTIEIIDVCLCLFLFYILIDCVLFCLYCGFYIDVYNLQNSVS